MTWRTGRKVGRTIYNGDTLIGVMDTAELARIVVAAVNAQERDRDPRHEGWCQDGRYAGDGTCDYCAADMGGVST